MRLYAIHAPLAAPSAPEKIRAARTGFSLAGLVFGPLWLLARGLWPAFVIYAAAWAAGAAAVHAGVLAPGAALLLDALAHFYVGLEGRGMRAQAGRPVADVIFAHSSLEAEKLFLERFFRQTPASGMGAPMHNEIIGSFPEPGR